MKPLHVRIAALSIVTFGLLIGCGKKSGSPTTAPAPAGQCSISPSSVDLDSVVVGRSVDRQVTLTNNGSGTLSGSFSGCTGFLVVGGTGYSLAPGASKNVTVRFTPTSVGTYGCSVSSGQGGCAIPCSGVGVPDPDSCVVSPASLDFGSVTVGQSADRTFTITHPGFGTLSGTLVESCPDFAFVGSTSYSLDHNQSATFTVRFSPSRTGAQSCTISGPHCPAASSFEPAKRRGLTVLKVERVRGHPWLLIDRSPRAT